MKVLILSKYAPVVTFGSNPRWFELAKQFVLRGMTVDIVTSDSNHGSTLTLEGSKNQIFTSDGVTFHALKGLKYSKTKSVMRVLSWFHFDVVAANYLRRFSPDVIVISSLSLTSILIGIFLRQFGNCKLVFEVRDIWPLTLIVEGGFSRWHPLALYLRFIELWGYRRADLIVGTMPNLKQHVIESGIHKPDSAFHTCGIGVSPGRAAEVEPFTFSPDIEARLQSRTIIGYCGSIGLTNNLHDFVEYIHSCDRDDVMFVIAGDGADRVQFQARLKGRENVAFLGRVSADQVQGLLRRCDILFLSTLPSRVWDYGQSMNKIVDYMLAGKYIVAQYTGYPSFINEAGCGVFTDGTGLAYSLDAAIAMPRVKRDSAGLAGRNWLLENQNYEKLASDYLQKIENCIQARP